MASARASAASALGAVASPRTTRTICATLWEIANAPHRPVVVVLTSGGLKDYGASRAWLPDVPAAGRDFASTLTVLEERYGLRLRP